MKEREDKDKHVTEHDERQIRDALKRSFPPVETELQRDLWPDVLRKLDLRPVRVPWYDWALVGMSAVMFLAFPRLVLVFAYHL
jgi:hypothetical protein